MWPESSELQAWKIVVQLDTLPLQLIPETFNFKSQSTFLIQKRHKNIYPIFDYLFYKSHSLIREEFEFREVSIYKHAIRDVGHLTIVKFETTVVKCQKGETVIFIYISVK